MADKATFEILPSAARTSTPTISTITSTTPGVETQNMTDLQITIDVTAVTATPSVQPALQGQDATSGEWFDLVAAITAITATGTTTIKYGENAAVVANNANQGFIPKTIRLTMTHADADSITYSVGMNFKTS